MTASAPLGALTPTERSLLALLAQGHTAKTAAAQTGLSVAAVNERLRSARRKTGAGSSRELARLLSQENRDEEIGLSSSGGGAAAAATPATSRAGRRTMMAMTILAAAAAAATLGTQQVAPIELPASDPLLGKVISARTLADWHRDLRAEQRDPQWARARETALTALYSRIPNLVSNGQQLRVRCGRTICEVAVAWPKGLDREKEPQLLNDLQSLELSKQVRALGFTGKDGAANFGETFVAYFLRGKD